MSRIVNVVSTAVLVNGQQRGVESTVVLGPRGGTLKTKQTLLKVGMYLLTRSQRLLGQVIILQRVTAIKGDVVTMTEVPVNEWTDSVSDKARLLSDKVAAAYHNMYK